MSQLLVSRSESNPLIKPADVKPSFENFKVDGVFNCGAIKCKDEYILLCRVAESLKNDDERVVKIPVVSCKDGKEFVDIRTVDRSVKHLDFDDSRIIWQTENGHRTKVEYLTSISHIRLARSSDGVNFTVEERPFIFPNANEESWGVEDPRVTQIGEEFFINYTAVSPIGVTTALAKTTDFKSFERLGIIFEPDNKDVTIFPEKINGLYMAFNRPSPSGIGSPDIWISTSPDLIHWGNHKHFRGVSKDDSWDNGRIGGGAVPFRTEKGWVKIYHAADKNNRYCLGAFLLDGNDPTKLLKKSLKPILEPEASYETEGFFGNVVFTCGCVYENDIVKIYYGASDDTVCLAEIPIDEIYKSME